ncbi:MAG: peptidoglycan D,D-transpeptidase FtsI family protein [Planctomycetota bacterium]|jgi:penicillin-binding protein 2
MYHYRLKIFIMLCIGSLIIAVGRLVTLQTFQAEKARQELENLRIRNPDSLPTIRGQILDRYGKPLALDRPAFFLHINYQLTRYMDPRWREGKILRKLAADKDKTRDEVKKELDEEWRNDQSKLEKAVDLALQLADVSREEVEANIQQINDSIWEQARYLSWKWKNPEKDWQAYRNERDSIPLDQIAGTKLGIMNESYPLVELKTHQDRLRAQRELLNLTELTIVSESKRDYPYGRAACQLIGWVAPWQDHEAEIFKDNKYMRYKPGEVAGKWGLEKVYEPVLRGRRGEVQYDIDGNLLDRKESQNGQDIRLTLDIDLQQKVEAALADNTLPHGNKYCAAVVLEVAGNDILAMASMPTFDLKTIRQPENYNHFFDPNDPNKLYQNKALERNYPPGSTAKPLVLIAGLEEHKISSGEVISCTGYPPKKGWPRCILQRDYGIGHDDHFRGEGGNTARNAIRGSCNVYFSRLAHRLSSEQLQSWLFQFGYGQEVLHVPSLFNDLSDAEFDNRQLRQSYGCLEFKIVQSKVSSASELDPLPLYEKKWWGMGQGSLRVTVLQVANAMSTIARDGIYKAPRLVYDEADPQNETGMRSLGVSKSTLSVVRDGVHAVVYEPHGTAYNEFNKPGDRSVLFDRDMTIYGKTGSTQDPEHAWFECFAEDRSGRAVVVTVLVERGARGAGEAAPLGHRILRYCNEAGYVGKRPDQP